MPARGVDFPEGKILYLMIGISGSGKTTFADWFGGENGITVISSDLVRKRMFGSEDFVFQNEKEIWAEIKSIIPSLLKEGSVIFDATNVSVKSRKFFVRASEEVGAKVCAIYIDASLEDANRRNLGRDRKVPGEVISRQSSSLKLPSFEEIPVFVNVLKFKQDTATVRISSLATRTSSGNYPYKYLRETIDRHAKGS
jgi:predicted kinase